MSSPYDSIRRAEIESAIKAAEFDTSGEIRVHIEERCPEEVLDRAAFVFSELEMHTTAQRNGVLIYVSLDDHKFAIIGDAGINAKVPGNFWESTAGLMKTHFAKSEITEGICAGIAEAGKQLKSYFPYHQEDKNELSNEVTFGNPSAL